MTCNQREKEWYMEEFESLKFNDRRLDNRFQALCSQFNRAPQAIVRQVIEDVHQCKAAYRFWANEKVKSAEMLNSHRKSIGKRIEDQPIVLEVQDSTELDFLSHIKKTGKGQTGRGITAGGYQMHLTLMTSPNREPLGIGSLRLWARKPKRKEQGREVRKLPWEEKESYKWVRALRDADMVECPKQKRVLVADREADFYEYIRLLKDEGRQFVIRLKWNRSVDKGACTIRQLIDTKTSLGLHDVALLSKGGPSAREARILHLEVRAIQESLEFEDNSRRKDRIPLTVVQGKEPREDGEEWLLLTNLPVNGLADACQIIDWYACRWEIEDFFKLLKGTYKIEDIRLSTKERTEKLIVFLSILCYRLFWITKVSRVQGDLPARLVFTDREIQIAQRLGRQRSLANELTIGQMVVQIAMLGGYWNRKSDAPPGCMVIWRGWKRMQDILYWEFELVN